MPQVFISYAREDEEKARRLYDDLEVLNLNPWLDKKRLRGGQVWKTEIRKAISESSHFIILISENSVGKAGYVQKEIRTALEMLELLPPGEVFVIPVRLDNTKPAFEELREIQWIDVFPSYQDGLIQIWRAISSSDKVPALLYSGEESRLLFELMRRGESGKRLAVWGRSGQYRDRVLDEIVTLCREVPKSLVIKHDLSSYRDSDAGPLIPLVRSILKIVPEELHGTEEYELLDAEEGELHISQILGMASDLLSWSLRDGQEVFFLITNPESLAVYGILQHLPRLGLVAELLRFIRDIVVPGATIMLFADRKVLGDVLTEEKEHSQAARAVNLLDVFDATYPLKLE